MATLTRSNSRVNPPIYKDYVNFLASYKNGKKEDETDCAIPVKNFSLASSSNSTSSSSLSSDEVPKNSCTPYNTFLENSKNKKFSSVKPAIEEKKEERIDEITKFSCLKPAFEENKEKVEEKNLKKSELYIEIQPAKSVSEVSKMFEHQQTKKPTAKSTTMNSKIRIFEKQISIEKPKISHKPVFNKSPPPPKVDIYKDAAETSPLPEPVASENNAPPPPPLPSNNTIITQKTVIINNSPPPVKTINVSFPPPPPPPPASQGVKLQATLTKGPTTTYSVNSPNGVVEIDRNNPLVKKLVYGTLRGLYGAYHDKASDMLATLPKNMVVRSNGVQDRIEQIAANGDLDKLNGRINPKLEQE